MAMLKTLMNLAVTAMLIKLAMAANHTVGGTNNGWDTTTNLQAWVSSQSFSVGDNLVFQYTLNHDVLEVTKTDFDSCQTSNPFLMFNGGSTIIALTSPGKRYFTCGTIGHCGQGMKVEIDTLATSAPPPAPTNSPRPSSPSTQPPASSVNPPTPATPPHASPIAPPVSSPRSETSTPTPTQPPKSAPTMSPSQSKAPTSSPTSSPNVPSTESPANSPNGSSPKPSPSAANKGSFLNQLTMGLGFIVMILLAL